MEAGARHGRTKSAAAIEGNLHSQRHKSVPAQSSYGRAISTENLLLSSSKQGSGMPIKKLLAQEMVKENETQRKQPSVIARLMGLDGLPSPQPCHKQQRKSLEKNEKRTASINIPQEKHFASQPSRIDSVDQQDFKDVYEDMEASHAMSHRCSSRWIANSSILSPEITISQQKFTSKKCHPSYQEVNGTLSFIDSSNELLLKYLEQPDFMFLKYYHKLQYDPPSSPYDHISSSEMSNCVKHQGYSKVQKLTRDGPYKHDKSRIKRVDGLLLQHRNNPVSRNFGQASPTQGNVEDDINTPTTRIVVLKPNVGKRVNATYVLSPDSSHPSSATLRKPLQYTGSGTGDKLSCRKKNSSKKAYSTKSISREGTKISKESTRKRTKHLKSSSGLRGYAGDESSYDAYEIDSSSASEAMITSSRNSSSGLFESMVSKEAKKRLSERWKVTYYCQSMEPTPKVSTLGEMLAVPKKDSVHEHIYSRTAPDEPNEIYLGNSDSTNWDGPQGISSRDGWKEGYFRTSSRSRYLPPSLGNRTRKTNGRRETDAGDYVKKEKDTGKIKSRKGSIRKEGDFLKNVDVLCKFKSDPCLDKPVDHSGSSRDVSSCQIVTDVNFYKGLHHESNSMHTQAPDLAVSSACFTSDLAENIEPEPSTLSSDPFSDLCPKHGDSFLSHDGSTALNQEDVALEELIKSEAESTSFESCRLELESYESSKEADHCSPVSVLEVSFSEDASCSPDSFETVQAKLKRLRNELQLLKMESGDFTDNPMFLENNLDTMQLQPEKIFEDKHIVGDDTWEYSYIDDILLFSVLDNFDPDTLNLTQWQYSPECPLGSWVFNSLEKKYNDEKNELKCERRFLFDLVNSALLDMFHVYLIRSHLPQPLIIGVPKWQRQRIKDHLKGLLFHQEDTVSREKREILLDREMNWVGFRDSIGTVGEEIEKMLVDDLIGEIVTM